MNRETFTQSLFRHYKEQNQGKLPKTMLAEYDVRAKRFIPGYNLCKESDNQCVAIDCSKILPGEFGIHQDDIQKACGLFNVDRNGNVLEYAQIRVINEEGKWSHYDVSSKALHNMEGEVIKLLFIICNVDEELKQREELQYMIKFDKLTGLLSAEGFFSEATEFMRKKTGTFMIVRVDIKNFSLANAILGTENSDKILMEMAAMLTASLGKKSVIGRIGADIFAICIHKDDLIDQAYFIFSEGRFRSKELNYEVEFATGIYEADNIEESVAHMCAKANVAMGEAKRKNYGNIGIYESHIEKRYFDQQELSNEKLSALESGQFKVYLQPQCSLDNGIVESAEALVRWEHPTRNIISPIEFIPLFEANGFIKRLDEYIIKEVCQILLQWKEEGKRLMPISVNISRVDLFDINLCAKIKNIVDAYGIEPKYIELEITETAYMDKPELMQKTMGELRNIGFKVIMDDFGSGYSSLNMLKNFQIDKLKIDLKFMEGLKENSRGKSILKFIVDMAKNLEMVTVAEGVEDQEQVKILSDIGCDYAQGFIYSKPVTLREFEASYMDEKSIVNI